jgi:hypothetical protein
MPPGDSVSKDKNVFTLTSALKRLGPCVTYYPALASLVGLKESIFLCQLIYWTPRARQDKGDGWIYKSAEEMTAETGLSYKEQVRLRKGLVEKKLLEETYERTEHRLYFRVCSEELDRLGEHLPVGHMPESKVAPDQKEDGTLPKGRWHLPKGQFDKGSRDYTETTTETTQKSLTSSQSSLGESSKKPEEKEKDPRHHAFREKYKNLYMRANRCPAGEVPWGPKESGMLAKILTVQKNWSQKFLDTCLENYFKSEGNPAEPISVWMHRLPAWRNGPLMGRGRYGAPVIDAPRHVNPLDELRRQKGQRAESSGTVG